jgi:hypothetical protein
VTDYHWPHQRQRATQLFAGETPRPQLEQDILDVFAEQPELVAAAIDQIGHQFATGKIRSGWAVLRTHVLNAATPQADLTVTDTTTREKRIQQAQQLLRTCGPHFDRHTEILDELFGDRGLLKPWHNDQPLRQRMLDQWAEQRQRGEQHEADEHERSQRFVEQRRCPNCGTITPFAMRPCTTLQCRRRAIAAALVAEAEQANIAPDQEPQLDPEPILDPDAEPVLA